MNPRDQEQFDDLDLRQTHMEKNLAQMRLDLRELKIRVIADEPKSGVVPFTPPPFLFTPLPPPVESEPIPMIPPAPIEPEPLPIPEITPEPPSPAPPAEPGPSLEDRFFRWLARIGVVLLLITIVSFSRMAYNHYYQFMGPWSKLAILGFVSVGCLVGGLVLERRNSSLIIYGRTLAAGGLACLYYTLYGASYVAQLHVIDSPLVGGFLLLGWSAGVLWLAEKKKSELLSIFAIALAYFSSAITPVGGFTMAANLILSVSAVVFLIRNSWTGLSYLCLIGTYAGLLRQLVPGDGFQFVSDLTFAPSAIYLLGAWIIYTAGIFLAATPAFVAGKRMAFLCLNNGAFIGLLVLVATLSHFGHVGGLLAGVGALFLATSALARFTRPETVELAPAYLIQGMTLATSGIMIAYTGLTRGLLLTVESVFLVASGAYARNPFYRWAGNICGLFGTLFLLAEIIPGTAYPWMLILGGAGAMLANAYFSRKNRDVEPFSPEAAFHICLAMLLLMVGYHIELSDLGYPAALALTALGLTAAAYFIPLLELAVFAQFMLVLAQLFGLALGTGQDAWQSQFVVAAATTAMIFGWTRQRKIAKADWFAPVLGMYALAVVALVSLALKGLLPAEAVVAAFFALATAVMGTGLALRSAPVLRAALGFNAIGAALYCNQIVSLSNHGNTDMTAFGLVLLLAQPALLRYWGRELLSSLEAWYLILISTGLAGGFITVACREPGGMPMTLGWGLYALALIVIGFFANERRQRWCGLVVLALALLRIGVFDFWQFSDEGKVATFFGLTVICLGLSFLYYKFAARFKEWL